MGTSSSSDGPGGGVPMVPPWADDPPSNDDSAVSNGENDDLNSPQSPISASPISPKARFGGARKSMGLFAHSGSQSDMRRGVGRYVSKGYGGASTAARRFSGTARTAALLAGALSSQARGAPGGTHIDIARTQGKSANEIMDVIVDAVRPINGTQDAEAARESVKDALSELLDKQPDANLLELDDKAREFVVESFVVADVFRRILLDIGKHIQDSSPNAVTGLKRLRQVKDYVRETVKAAFSKLKLSGTTTENKNIVNITKQALLATMQVFEGYAR